MLDVRIECRGGGGVRPLVNNSVARSGTVIAFARHTGKGDEPPIGRRQQPSSGGGDSPAIEATAQISANVPGTAQSTVHRLVQQFTQCLAVVLRTAELNPAPARLPMLPHGD